MGGGRGSSSGCRRGRKNLGKGPAMRGGSTTMLMLSKDT